MVRSAEVPMGDRREVVGSRLRGLRGRRFHHHPHERLGAARPDEHPAMVPEHRLDGGDVGSQALRHVGCPVGDPARPGPRTPSTAEVPACTWRAMNSVCP